MKENPEVVVIGAAALDTKGMASSIPVYGMAVPGKVKISPGGVARNIAENLARLGVHSTLLTVVGNDPAGKQILEQAKESGIDVSRIEVIKGERTASYLAILDQSGSPLASVYDMKIMQHLTPQYIQKNRRIISKASMVIIDANIPPESIETIVSITSKHSIPLCADPTSSDLAEKLIPFLKDFYLLTPNEAEAEILSGKRVYDRDSAILAAKELVSKGVKIAVITMAEMGVCYSTPSTSGHVPAIRVEVVDFTGAGDALTAGTVFGLLNDFSVDEAIRIGVAAATLTLRCEETVCPDISLEKVYEGLII
ncbi:MAG: carbohydrate kinase family protein [Anaerolineae bacterium]|nr:carbohydrate kinase family protein [Anaerolineae bacterium]MDW8102650.1 carbohydrate kinase family protein [Anaerolineae bacterium]